ncbi:DNA methyltransferase [Deinococcus radiophilus]|uniref:Site-specific DNA-methyltransferase n=1 Tax=Deinococcus radiophilus TaxID=32062 RepID=A0A3S0I7A8_9DEIO|nr:site-specific DNA-methyltransferase [Deinococcus radiophilus]RTR29088.1 site-specific DNA-methyltransferase [Deinococcus radiophilus]UFA49676.1 site-specific DNA-methyltransferase [Deinococcus radiophilus]
MTVKSRYDHLSREDLIALLQTRDASRKFGLVWERSEIEHERALNDDFVALNLIKDLSYGNKPYRNMIIEGDNFDALRFLNLTHRGQIKCIYIDPPYNTGNNDFIYNDRYINKNDAYPESTWLEFMYQRLILARDLLTNDGVLFVSIDENEVAPLTMLLDQIFPQGKVGTFVWRSVGDNFSFTLS